MQEPMTPTLPEAPCSPRARGDRRRDVTHAAVEIERLIELKSLPLFPLVELVHIDTRRGSPEQIR
jgi:hypothetical protein